MFFFYLMSQQKKSCVYIFLFFILLTFFVNYLNCFVQVGFEGIRIKTKKIKKTIHFADSASIRGKQLHCNQTLESTASFTRA